MSLKRYNVTLIHHTHIKPGTTYCPYNVRTGEVETVPDVGWPGSLAKWETLSPKIRWKNDRGRR